jgi:predicted NBD/HSP70 family sugar kinase
VSLSFDTAAPASAALSGHAVPAKTLYGGLELGGTKTQVAIGHDDGAILVRETLPTRRGLWLLAGNQQAWVERFR